MSYTGQPSGERVPARTELLDKLLAQSLISQQEFERAKKQLGEQGERIICPSCRASLPATATSCFNCGYRLAGDAALSVSGESPAGNDGKVPVIETRPLLTLIALGIMFWVEAVWIGSRVTYYYDSGYSFMFFLVYLMFFVGAIAMAIGTTFLLFRSRLVWKDTAENKPSSR